MELKVFIPVPTWVGKLKDNKVYVAWFFVLAFDIYAVTNIYGAQLSKARKTNFHQYCTSLPLHGAAKTLMEFRYWFLLANIALLIYGIVKLLSSNRLRLGLRRTRLAWLVPITVTISATILISLMTTQCWN